MTNPVKTMLNSLYDVFEDKFPDRYEAWDRYLEFIATDHNATLLSQVNHRFDWLIKDDSLASKVLDIYQPHILKSDCHDYLGEIYSERCLSSKEAQNKGQFLTPHHVAKTMARMLIRTTKRDITVLDPSVGTGRLFLAGQELAPNAYFFGVDIDNRMVRIAYTNMLIHNIRGFVLHADSLRHEIDISKEDGMHNWRFSNKWESHVDQLKMSAKPAQRNLFENGT